MKSKLQVILHNENELPSCHLKMTLTVQFSQSCYFGNNEITGVMIKLGGLTHFHNKSHGESPKPCELLYLS